MPADRCGRRGRPRSGRPQPRAGGGLEGRFIFGVVALFVPFWGLVAAFRLAKPDSPWARSRYKGARAGRMERARARFPRIGGRPH